MAEGLQDKGISEEDRYGDTADRQNTAGKGLLRRIQEPEYETEKITSLVYVVQDCVTNNCSSAR
jgi:hypothetical protein